MVCPLKLFRLQSSAFSLSTFSLNTFILAIALFAASTALAQDEPQRKPLSLREGAAAVLENNLDLIVERVAPLVAALDVDSARAVYDPETFTLLKRTEAKTPLSARSQTAAGGLSSSESEGYTLEAGVEGRLALGAKYTLEVKEERTADTFNRFEPQFASFAGLKLTQPLFKNLGREATEYQINVAGKNRDISVHKLKGRLLETLSEYCGVYWDLLQLREELKVREESLRLAETLLELNRKKFRAGVMSALDVSHAESAAAARLDQVLIARRGVKDKEAALKLLISGDVYGIKDVELTPSEEASVEPVEAKLDDALKTAFSKRPDYLELKSEIEKSRLRIRYAENQRYPLIDLEASYGFNGLGETAGQSWRSLDSNPEWSLGVRFKMPLEGTGAQAELAGARLASSQSLLKLKRLEQRTIIKTDLIIKDLRDCLIRAMNAKRSTALAKNTLKAEEEKLNAGLSTTYSVLKVQDDLSMARLNEIGASIDYNKTLVRYNMEKGTLLEALGLKFGDETGR
ncbi:MAG: TolC family protein [Deltaproteobacteria bacterium]|nr:TolC family protein [Deltaproteobacteria bacterium]